MQSAEGDRAATASKEEDLPSYFRRLDHSFIGIQKAEDDEYRYRASDVLVQATWELPIVVQWPNSSVHYEFSSTPGDISFGIVFVAAPDESEAVDDLEIETVEEMDLVPSSADLISGSFDVPNEGVVFFIWDNNFDWSSVKKISYSIRVNQPSFTLPDSDRCTESLHSVRRLVDEMQIMQIHRADAYDAAEHNTANVTFLEEQVAKLERKIQAKKAEFEGVVSTVASCEHKIKLLQHSRAGLCIRMLNRHLLGCVLSFLPANHGASSTCKYWNEIMATHDYICEPDKWYLGKLNKSEKNRLLFEIRLRKQAIEQRNLARARSDGPSGAQLLNSHVERKEASEAKAGGQGAEVSSVSSSASDRAQSPPRSPVKSGIQISLHHVLPQMSPEVPQPSPAAMEAAGPLKLHKVPAIAEGKGSRHRPLKESSTRSEKSSQSRRKSTHDSLLQNIQQIRSEQHLNSIVEYINAGLLKIESLSNEKRRVKKLIKAWNASYERQHGRIPAASERKGHLRELHEEYQQLSLALRVRKDKLDEVLSKVGLTLQQFEELRNKRFSDL